MCMIPFTFIRILCQSNGRRNWCLLVLLLFLILYSFLVWHQLDYPYRAYLSTDEGYETESNDSHGTRVSANRMSGNVHNISHPYAADFKCVVTRTVPTTTVCIFSPFRDMYISHDLEETGKWESHLADEFLEALRRNPTTGVIDIGANIGYYTMLAASSGHNVVAVEPNLECIHRIQRAAQIENVANRITVLHNAVADVRTMATVRMSGDNQGDTRISLEVKECTGSCPPTINTIVLNDIESHVTFTHAVVKMDMQGYEHRAFQHANDLFDRVTVTHVFMEWMVLRDYHEANDNSNTDASIDKNSRAASRARNLADYSDERRSNMTLLTERTFVENMLRFLFTRNYRPYALSASGGRALDASEWNRWPDDVVWHLTPGQDTHAKLLSNHFMYWPH